MPQTASECKGSAKVLVFLDALEHPHKELIVALRRLVLSLDTRIREDIKWNAPSFLIAGHFATFKLHPPKLVQLVLHTDAKVKEGPKQFEIEDPAGLLKWAAPDRCVLTIGSPAELERHQLAVERIIRSWIGQLG